MTDAQLLEDVKGYLRVDFADEDALIGGFILGAKRYLRNAGVKDSLNNDELYQVVVKMLVSLFYENRNVAESKLLVPPVINNFIVQLCSRSNISN